MASAYPTTGYLRLPVSMDLLDEVSEAVDRFNREFPVRCGPLALFLAQEVWIHPYDVADFLAFVPRHFANELSLFRIRKEAMRQVQELPAGDTLLECLRRVRWNEPLTFLDV